MDSTIVELERPWTGTIDWSTLKKWPQVVARRVGDRDEWVLGVSSSTPPSSMPQVGGTGVFGHVCYEAKNRFEALSSRHEPMDGFPESHWWNARHSVIFKGSTAVLRTKREHIDEGGELLDALLREPPSRRALPFVEWKRQTPRDEYLAELGKLLGHIHRGDIYEVNYCTQRKANLPGFDPYTAFAALLHHTDAPFAGFLRHGDNYALCASPERFLHIEGRRVVTQPIKGTRPRHNDPAQDLALAAELAADAKENSEHVMAVDVARNDLGRVAVQGSVQVEELRAVKSYATVHQMVSTVAALLRPDVSPNELLRATFPMASMTGAPKVRAMQLIDEAEGMARGIFSGSFGFFLPDGSADLNVVIRTLTYNAATGDASLITGGAITAASVPEQEWEECELKARSVLNAFGHA